MRARLVVAAMLVALAFYAGLIGIRGVALLREGGVGPVLLGLALLVLPVVGAVVAWREVQFGRRTARLGRTLEAEGAVPLLDVPRRPSGRFDRSRADEAFGELRTEVEQDPRSWRAWYRLALAYDAAGDRSRARAAARHAVELASEPR